MKHYFTWFNVICCVVLLIFTFREYYSIPIHQYLLDAALLVYPCFCSYRNLVCYTSFLIPISTGVNTILYLPLLLILFFRCPQVNVYQWVFTAIFMFMELLLMWSTSYPPQYNKYLIYMGMFGTFMFLFFDKTGGIDYAKAIRWFIIGTGFVLVAILIRSYNTAGGIMQLYTLRIGEVMYYDESISGNLRVFSINANTIGIYSVVAYCLLLLGVKELKMNKVMYIASFFAVLVPGAFTTSRTWLLLCVLSTGLYIMRYFKLRHFIFWAIVLFFVGGNIIFYVSGIAEQFIDRLTNTTEIATANGRTDLFAAYNDFLLNHPLRLFFGTSAMQYKEVTGIFHSTHNATQQIYMSYGIWGMALFIYIPYLFYKMFIKRCHIKLKFFLPIISAFLFSQTIQFLVPEYIMMTFIVAAMAIKYGRQISLCNMTVSHRHE